MSEDSCSYDCSRPPMGLVSYPDVSGIGVALSNTITAGIAVLIVSGYYVFAFLPDQSPFDASPSDSYKPNPIDVCILKVFRRRKSTTTMSNTGVDTSSTRFQRALMRCMLIMSDLQLLTGISLLISGFTQLRCGLQTLHWRKIIYMAWFSSVTHLACLTFLRRYLYRYKTKRLWRLLAMSVLVILLMIALVPTESYPASDEGYYNYRDPKSGDNATSFSDYAICYFDLHERPFTTYTVRTNRKFVTLSILILATGMLSRIIRLHSIPSQKIQTMGTFCYEKSTDLLSKIYYRCRDPTRFSALQCILLYRPALSVFLVARLLCTFLSSMAFEVWWVQISFVWGALRYWYPLEFIRQVPRGFGEAESRAWTFGQVLPLLSLVVPLIMMFDEWNSEKDTDELAAAEPSSQTTQQTDTILIVANPPAPDYNFYLSSWMISYTVFFLLAIVGVTLFIVAFVLLSFKTPSNVVIPDKVRSNWLPFAFLSFLYFCTLFSLSLDKYAYGPKFQSRIVHICRILVYSSLLGIFIAMPIVNVAGRFVRYFDAVGYREKETEHIDPINPNWCFYGIGGYTALYLVFEACGELWLKKWCEFPEGEFHEGEFSE